MSVVTRFAPSPTGFLHIGGARTALFSWLYAKKHHGKFILRMEDTDKERSTSEAVNAVLDGMKWLGLDYDEGPLYQSKRFDRYEQMIKKLIDEDKAYRCYCSKERLEILRNQQMMRKEKPRYDGNCRYSSHNQEGDFVIRFKNPAEGTVSFFDHVYGEISFSNAELDDLIIKRTDGTPTYNFCVVVDDWDMGITNVIRGDDHLNNTPRQINIIEALGAPKPEYAHLPMILGKDGKKMSKRHGSVSVTEYREQGYLPEAVLNYLVRLGWSHGDQEIFSVKEMISLFDLDNVNKSGAKYDAQKLEWMNQEYIKSMPKNEIALRLNWYLDKVGVESIDNVDMNALVEALAPRSKTLVEMAQKSVCFFSKTVTYNADAKQTYLTPEAVDVLELVYKKLGTLESWNIEKIKALVKEVLVQKELKMPQLAQPMRVALTGNTISPSIDATVFILGRDKTLAFLEHAISEAKAGVQA